MFSPSKLFFLIASLNLFISIMIPEYLQRLIYLQIDYTTNKNINNISYITYLKNMKYPPKFHKIFFKTISKNSNALFNHFYFIGRNSVKIRLKFGRKQGENSLQENFFMM